MTPYEKLVFEYARIVREARTYPLGGFPALPRVAVGPGAPKMLYFAPHPDDETIIGGLAYRLLREGKWNVLDVAVTQGSNKARQAGRLEELKGACKYLGFGLIQTAPNGLEKVTPATRAKEPKLWGEMVGVIARIIAEHLPKAVSIPHEFDWNGTHIGTHFLVLDALRTLTGFGCYVVETEFWGQMAQPNLMVEYSESDVAALVTATSFHVGEVQRNPYHLLIPAWMMDNVRLGSETVGGQGQAAPDYCFASLFRVSKWAGGKLEAAWSGGRYLPKSANPASLFE